MIDYFEAYYETYGRSVELIPYESSGIANDEVAARADAVRIAEDIQPFMVWSGPAFTNAFADELAARGVLCLACTPAQPPEWYTEREPFVWSGSTPAATRSRATRPSSSSAARRQAGRVRRRRRPCDGAAVRPAVRRVERQLEAAGRRVRRDARGRRCRRRRDGLVRPRPDLDPAGRVTGDRQAQGRRCHDRAVEHRSDRASRLHPRGDGPAVLPRVAPGGRHTHRHDCLRPDVRPGPVGRTRSAARPWRRASSPRRSGYYRLYEWFNGEPPPAPDQIGVLAPFPAVFFGVPKMVGPDLTRERWAEALKGGIETIPAITQPYLSWGGPDLWPYVDHPGIDDADADLVGPARDRPRRDPPRRHRDVAVRRRRCARSCRGHGRPRRGCSTPGHRSRSSRTLRRKKRHPTIRARRADPGARTAQARAPRACRRGAPRRRRS